MRETNDWFHRRQGAFDDALAATERLLEAGMKPRWQVFLTTRLLSELEEFLGLVEKLRLRDRVRALGGEFDIFMHPPGPDHEARKIEGLRPTTSQVVDMPKSIMGSSRKHFGREDLWQTETTLRAQILNGDERQRCEDLMPEVLWLFVCSNWDVFSNIGTLEPWWCLGNLKKDSVESIIRTFEEDEVLGLGVLLHESPTKLAESYGDPAGQKIYSSEGDLLSLYIGRHCEEEWNRR